MTLRPGSYDASRPRLRGVIRGDSFPWYVCTHEHGSTGEARQCAADALKEIRKLDPDNTGLHTDQLPAGWYVFNVSSHNRL